MALETHLSRTSSRYFSIISFFSASLLCYPSYHILTYSQIHHELDAQLNALLVQLESAATRKELVLRKQEEGLVAFLEGLKQARQQVSLLPLSHVPFSSLICLQLKMALGANSQTKALMFMEQLQRNLKKADEDCLLPRELAEIQLGEAPLDPPKGRPSLFVPSLAFFLF